MYNEIKVLSEIEHIRARPSLYIGETDNPTHLFHEVFDNALDEAVAGFATKIDVDLAQPGRLVVTDNGRGIPQNWNTQYKTWDPILIAIKLHSGGKFDKKAYTRATIGLNGIGLTACNALSAEMQIVTRRDGKEFSVVFEEGKPRKPDIVDVPNSSGTVVRLKPSARFFTTTVFDRLVVTNRLRLASTFVPGLTNTLDGVKVDPYTPEELIPNCGMVFDSSFSVNGETIRCFFGYNLSSQNRNTNRGSVNLLEVNYGSHIRVFERAVKDAWLSLLGSEDKHLLREDDFLCGIRGFTLVHLLNPSYTSQTKDTLTGSLRNYSHLVDGLAKEIAKVLGSSKKVFEGLLRKFRDYRHSLNKLSSTAYLDDVISYGAEDSVDRSISLDSKLVDCTSSDRANTELFICEGDAAAGSLIPFRDINIHAILPLRGKVMNVVDCDIKHILDNLEIRSMINAIGCGCLHREDVSKIRYSKIVLSADADVDGQNIAALLLGALCYLVPGVVQSGYVYIAEMPLFGQYLKRPKGEFRPVYSQKNLNPHWETIRFKGLGSMDPEELCTALLDPAYRRLTKVVLNSARDVTDLVGNSSIRKAMLVGKRVVIL